MGSCSALQPGRCKGREEDLCNSGLVLPRVHTLTKRSERKEKEMGSLTELMTFVSMSEINRAKMREIKMSIFDTEWTYGNTA